MSIQSTTWLRNIQFFTKSKPTSTHNLKTEFEAYKRPTDFVVVMNHKCFCTVDTPVCTVGGQDLAEDIVQVYWYICKWQFVYVFHTQKNIIRIFLNNFTETIIYIICYKKLNTILIKILSDFKNALRFYISGVPMKWYDYIMLNIYFLL